MQVASGKGSSAASPHSSVTVYVLYPHDAQEPATFCALEVVHVPEHSTNVVAQPQTGDWPSEPGATIVAVAGELYAL